VRRDNSTISFTFSVIRILVSLVSDLKVWILWWNCPISHSRPWLIITNNVQLNCRCMYMYILNEVWVDVEHKLKTTIFTCSKYSFILHQYLLIKIDFPICPRYFTMPKDLSENLTFSLLSHQVIFTGVKLMTVTAITVIPRWRTWNRVRIFFVN
jgi:hypothetical protein